MLERDHGMKELAHNSKTLHGSPRSAPAALLPTRSLLRALFHTVFDRRLLLPHPHRPLSPLPCRLPPTSTPLPRSIQFA